MGSVGWCIKGKKHNKHRASSYCCVAIYPLKSYAMLHFTHELAYNGFLYRCHIDWEDY